MKSTLKENYLVKKRNVLNELRATSMTLQELRFFAIYLSKINPNDLRTRIVRFSIYDFQAIMDLGRINIDSMKNVTNRLLCKVVNVPNERGGYNGFQLFKECVVDTDDKGEWYVEIDAHDKALPLMFEYKDKYFTYRLHNALRLKSSNQICMYESLKRFEKIGTRILSIEELREILGISKNMYKAYKDFRIYVLDACQQALKESTDIKFTYEPYGKRGKAGKIQFLKFTIEKNTNYVDQLTLDMYIEEKKQEIKILATAGEDCDEQEEMSPYGKRIEFLVGACDDEFTEKEISVLYDLMREILPNEKILTDTMCFDYLMRKYREMEMRNEKSVIKHRFGYMKKIIGVD
jgi:plasmid replication initiation protein